MSKPSFFIDLDCQDAKQLYKCVKIYPEYDWYLGFQFTGGIPERLPEKLGRKKQQRLQLFNIPCPNLPIEGHYIGLYCSNTEKDVYNYCKEFLEKHSKDIPVYIIHRQPRVKKK